MFVPTSSKIKLCVLFLGSLFLLIDGLKGGNSAGNHGRRLSALTGLVGLLSVGLELGWYFYIRFLQSHEIAVVYYLLWRCWGGAVISMFLYVIYRNAKVLLTASAVLLVVFNVFVITRHLHWTAGFTGHSDGLLGGIFISSLLLLWFDQPGRHIDSENTIQPKTSEKKP